MNSKDFTLVVPVYNDAKYLRKTLDSCVNQVEVLWLYDNCSTDGSTEICAEYAAKYEHVEHVLHEENLGAFENFKLPLFKCKTEYFMWFGAHDVMGENYVQPLLKSLRENLDAGLAVGKIFHMNEDDSPRKKVTDLSEWDEALQNEDDGLKRLAAFIKNHFGSRKHDSFLLHGIWRTESLRKAWVDIPCLAYDDAILGRAAAYDKIIYNNEAIFYARWFRKTRKKADEPKRIFHGGEVPTDGTMTRNILVLSIIDAIMEIAHQRQDAKDVFSLVKLVEKYAVSPKRARKRRLHTRIGMILGAIIGVALCVF